MTLKFGSLSKIAQLESMMFLTTIPNLRPSGTELVGVLSATFLKKGFLTNNQVLSAALHKTASSLFFYSRNSYVMTHFDSMKKANNILKFCLFSLVRVNHRTYVYFLEEIYVVL